MKSEKRKINYEIVKKNVTFAKQKEKVMEYIMTELEGVWILEPKVFGDSRGYFMEAWQRADFERHIGPVDFLQDNESKSSRGVLRGLHYQQGEWSQAKLVRVIQGRVLDVAVDLRRTSPTYGRHIVVELSDENHRQFFIPRGFAHGFLVLSPEAIFSYKVDNPYHPEAEQCIRYDDPTLNIQWPMPASELLLSEKDLRGQSFADAPKFE